MKCWQTTILDRVTWNNQPLRSASSHHTKVEFTVLLFMQKIQFQVLNSGLFLGTVSGYEPIFFAGTK